MSRTIENDCVGCPQGCVHCGREYDYELIRCDICGKTFTDPDDVMVFDELDICKNCKSDIYDLAEELREKLEGIPDFEEVVKGLEDVMNSMD